MKDEGLKERTGSEIRHGKQLAGGLAHSEDSIHVHMFIPHQQDSNIYVSSPVLKPGLWFSPAIVGKAHLLSTLRLLSGSFATLLP